MIQKVMPKINTIRPNRIHLKSSNSHLKNLAGSSMSGWNTPKFEPVEKIIPGGLDFKEKAYFLLTGKMPKSVLERWLPKNSDYVPGVDDQVVTVNVSGKYVGGIVEGPHDYLFEEGADNVVVDLDDNSGPSFDIDDDGDILS